MGFQTVSCRLREINRLHRSDDWSVDDEIERSAKNIVHDIRELLITLKNKTRVLDVGVCIT